MSLCLAILLIATYGLGLLFSLGTHREFFGTANHAEDDDAHWPIGVALATLAVVTVVVALISEVFVASVQGAALQLGMSQAFVGFIVVALVGGAAEMASAFCGGAEGPLGSQHRHCARKRRADRLVRGAGARASELRRRAFAHDVAVLAGCGGDDALRDAHASHGLHSGRTAWFTGALVLAVYLVFAITLYLLPPKV